MCGQSVITFAKVASIELILLLQFALLCHSMAYHGSSRYAFIHTQKKFNVQDHDFYGAKLPKYFIFPRTLDDYNLYLRHRNDFVNLQRGTSHILVKSSFVPSAIDSWNSLPEDLKNALPLSSLKRTLKRFSTIIFKVPGPDCTIINLD